MAAEFTQLIAASEPLCTLKRDAERGRLSHAYLLDAPDRLAGRMIMDAIAAFVLGGGAGLADAVRFPEADRETLAVSDADALIAGLYRRPSKGDMRFYLIDYAETMSPAVQNKLLKTLEEPPAGVCILLNCAAIHKLLPTVVSRCVRLEVLPFPASKICAALTDACGDGERAALAAALCRGSLTEAEAFMRDGKRLARFRNALEILTGLQSSKDVLDAVSRLTAQKDDCAETIAFFEMLLRDARVYQTGLHELLQLTSLKDEIAVLSEQYSATAIEKILPFLGKIRKRIQFNANKNSLLDELMFTMAEYRVRYRG